MDQRWAKTKKYYLENRLTAYPIDTLARAIGELWRPSPDLELLSDIIQLSWADLLSRDGFGPALSLRLLEILEQGMASKVAGKLQQAARTAEELKQYGLPSLIHVLPKCVYQRLLALRIRSLFDIRALSESEYLGVLSDVPTRLPYFRLLQRTAIIFPDSLIKLAQTSEVVVLPDDHTFTPTFDVFHRTFVYLNERIVAFSKNDLGKCVLLCRFPFFGPQIVPLETIGAYFGMTAAGVRRIQDDLESRLLAFFQGRYLHLGRCLASGKMTALFRDICGVFTFPRFLAKTNLVAELQKRFGFREKDHQSSYLFLVGALELEEVAVKDTVFLVGKKTIKADQMLKTANLAYSRLLQSADPISLDDLYAAVEQRGKNLLARDDAKALWLALPAFKKKEIDGVIHAHLAGAEISLGAKLYKVLSTVSEPLGLEEIEERVGMLDGGQDASVNPAAIRQVLSQDARFVPAGDRGCWTLKGLGEVRKSVRDLMIEILREAGGPLTKEEICVLVLRQRSDVAEKTIQIYLRKLKDTFLLIAKDQWILRADADHYSLTETSSITALEAIKRYYLAEGNPWCDGKTVARQIKEKYGFSQSYIVTILSKDKNIEKQMVGGRCQYRLAGQAAPPPPTPAPPVKFIRRRPKPVAPPEK